MSGSGFILILNGSPRSGKTSIARAIQEEDSRHWINIGVDWHISTLPEKLKPGIGLRPGGERPDLERDIPGLYEALFDSIAAHARLGFNVAADLGIHDGYSRPLGIWRLCAEHLRRLKVFIVGVRCGVEELMRRRTAGGGVYAGFLPDGSVPEIVLEWESAVHSGGFYDLELATDKLTPQACAQRIIALLDGSKPAAIESLLAASVCNQRNHNGRSPVNSL